MWHKNTCTVLKKHTQDNYKYFGAADKANLIIPSSTDVDRLLFLWLLDSSFHSSSMVWSVLQMHFLFVLIFLSCAFSLPIISSCFTCFLSYGQHQNSQPFYFIYSYHKSNAPSLFPIPCSLLVPLTIWIGYIFEKPKYILFGWRWVCLQALLITNITFTLCHINNIVYCQLPRKSFGERKLALLVFSHKIHCSTEFNGNWQKAFCINSGELVVSKRLIA